MDDGNSLFYNENGKTNADYNDRGFNPEYNVEPYRILPLNVYVFK